MKFVFLSLLSAVSLSIAISPAQAAIDQSTNSTLTDFSAIANPTLTNSSKDGDVQFSPQAVIRAERNSAEIAQVPAPTPVKSWTRPTLRITLPTRATQLKFSHNGDRLLTNGATEQSVELWDLTTGKRLSAFSAKAGFAICDIALSPDEQFAAALLYSRETSAMPTKRKVELKVWNLKTGQSQSSSPIQDHLIQTDQVPLCQVEFSPNNQLLATSVSSVANKAQAGVRVWTVPKGTLQQVTGSAVTAIYRLAFSRDSSLLGFTTVVNNQSQLHLWNVRDRKLQATLKAVQGRYFDTILDFRFSPNQQDAIAYAYDGGLMSRLYRWQIRTGRLISSSELPPDRSDGLLALSPDAQAYVYGGDVTGYHIGNLQSGRSWNFPQALSPMHQPEKVMFSPDGQQMAISEGQTIKILR